jgi:gas vesicle protein
MPNTTQIRIGLMIISAVIIITSAFFLAEYKNKNTQKLSYESNLSATAENIVSDQSLDSDHDGLKNWEEELLGTNKNNPDTDGDGTPDGKEVELHRNPLVKGPKDGEKDMQTNTQKNEKLAPIDFFARNFFARYMELKQAGVSNDKSSQEELALRVIKEGVVLTLPKEYLLKDISIVNDNSKEFVAKYIENVNEVFRNNQNRGKDESQIAKESLEKENPDLLKDIDPIIKTYKNVIASLVKVKVPSELSNNHLKMVNAMSGFLFVAESLRKTDKDALVALQGASRQLDAAKALGESLIYLRNYQK